MTQGASTNPCLPRFDTEWKSRGCSNKFLVTHKQVDTQISQIFNLMVDCRPPLIWKSNGKDLSDPIPYVMGRRQRWDATGYFNALFLHLNWFESRWCWVTSTTGRSPHLSAVFGMTTVCPRSGCSWTFVLGGPQAQHIPESQCHKTEEAAILT